MKTFEKWLDKSNYEFIIKNYKSEKDFLIKGSCGKSIVIIEPNKKGGKVFDDNGYMTQCASVKEIISLVDFLVGGVC